MTLTFIVSATAFVLYLQTGFFVLWKNREAPANRWFFLISAYLALVSLLLTLAHTTMSYDMTFSTLLRASWALIPAFLFRFHAFLAGVPRHKSIQDTWFLAFFFIGALVSLFMLSTLVTIEKDRLHLITEWFWIRLTWNYLFHALLFAGLLAVIYQYHHWRKQIAWRKERKEFSFVTYSIIIPAAVVSILQSFNPDFEVAALLKMPHVFLLPWFLILAFGFVRYTFSPPDPAKAARTVLNDLQQLLLFYDEQLQLKQMNAYAFKVLKYEKKEIRKLDFPKIFFDPNKVKQLLILAQKTGHAGPQETKLITSDGEQISFSVSCTLLKDKFGDSYGVAFYGEDLSEVYALRDEIRRKEEIENSLRNISDDLEAEAIKRSREIRLSLEEAEKKLVERIKAEELIKAEIAEMDVMMGEIHSRNKKNLNILLSVLEKSSNQRLTDTEKQHMLSLFHRIKSILLVNTQILGYDRYGMVRFKEFLELLVESFRESYTTAAGVEIIAEDKLLWIDQAVPLALVANELISNSFRHAFTGFSPNNPYIKIRYSHEKHLSCKLEVSDNGRGFSEISDINRSGYNGLHLAQLLVKDQLNGSLIMSHQKGATVVVNIPLDQIRQGHMGHDS